MHANTRNLTIAFFVLLVFGALSPMTLGSAKFPQWLEVVLGGLMSGVADLTVDGRIPDVGLCLERLAKKVSRTLSGCWRQSFRQPISLPPGNPLNWTFATDRNRRWCSASRVTFRHRQPPTTARGNG